MVHQDTKTRQTNLSTTRTDYKIAYYSVPKTWILEFLVLYKTNSPLIAFIRNSVGLNEDEHTPYQSTDTHLE